MKKDCAVNDAMQCARVLLLAMLVLASAQGAEYVVAPNGGDDAPGTREKPWKTIDKANKAAGPGDVVTFLPGDKPGRKVIEMWNGEKKQYLRYTVADVEEAFLKMFARNLDVDPRFANMEQDDYRLSKDSPCIDAGDFLARTIGAGKGTQIKVDDARWFYDGFGIEAETGDLIFVGETKRPARVTRVDREKNTIAVDREMTWADGETVSLPYAGRAPDPGAIESGADGEEWFRPVAVPKGIRWHPPTDPKAPLLLNDFEDATVEQWGFCWNLDRRKNTAYRRVNETSAGGQCSLYMYADKDQSILSADIKPWLWDVERYPFVRFSYRIPSGVPVGLWLDCFDTEQYGSDWVCLGGTASRAVGKNMDLKEYLLTDDDRWHTITVDARLVHKAYPDVKYVQSFKFLTLNNGKKGQGFWVDDFGIWPATDKK